MTESMCKRQAQESQILLGDVFEGLDPLCEVGKTQIYSFNRFVSTLCQDTTGGKLDIVLAFMKSSIAIFNRRAARISKTCNT